MGKKGVGRPKKARISKKSEEISNRMMNIDPQKIRKDGQEVIFQGIPTDRFCM